MDNGVSKILVDQVLDLRIETVGKKGDGLAKVDGFVIFVPNVKEGDNVKVKIKKVLTNVGFGEVIGKADAKVESKPVYNNAKPNSNSSENSEDDVAEEPIEDSEDFGDEIENK